jgi:hypothetical protein
MREWAVNSKPWFLAAKFIEAAEVLKTELIQLPADADIEEDDILFPPICLARLNRGRNVVAAAPQGRPRRNRINCVRLWGTATNPGIFDQNAALTTFGSTETMQMTIFSEKYTGALFREPSKQCELIPVLLFLSTSLPKSRKMDEKRP